MQAQMRADTRRKCKPKPHETNCNHAQAEAAPAARSAMHQKLRRRGKQKPFFSSPIKLQLEACNCNWPAAVCKVKGSCACLS